MICHAICTARLLACLPWPNSLQSDFSDACFFTFFSVVFTSFQISHIYVNCLKCVALWAHYNHFHSFFFVLTHTQTHTFQIVLAFWLTLVTLDYLFGFLFAFVRFSVTFSHCSSLSLSSLIDVFSYPDVLSFVKCQNETSRNGLRHVFFYVHGLLVSSNMWIVCCLAKAIVGSVYILMCAGSSKQHVFSFAFDSR